MQKNRRSGALEPPVTEPELELPAPENARSPANTWRLLFLDKAENLDRLKETSKEVGYVVVGATTIEEANAFLAGKDHVDVIICAAHLEQESMFTFLKSVRESALHRAATFLILSLEPGAVGARLDRSAAGAGMALGANAYVIMPRFDPAHLLEQIRSLRPAVPVLQTAQAD
jgi:CheY-like chemotaxis protein